MKPRLRAAPWTHEDSEILWRLIVRGRWCGRPRTNIDYRGADRRDADIMLAGALGGYVLVFRSAKYLIKWWFKAGHGMPGAHGTEQVARVLSGSQH